ncbi:MAG: TonB-dependent receptor [Spirochaetes bacterium]|nr:TonB-dependent receptor [Spirochaetota bacterium]
MRAFLFICLLSVSLSVYADTLSLEDIIVSDTLSPEEKHLTTRNVIILTKEDIHKNGYESVEEALDHFGLVDVMSRHQAVQSDISIRGSSFEQSLVLIDGVVFNNPQTGHHNLNIPLTLDDIERIEVMPGHSSSLYGSGGFGGTINLITKKNNDRNLHFSCGYGSFNSQNISAGASRTPGDYGLMVNLSRQRSDGFRYDTDFDIVTGRVSSLYYFNKEEYAHLSYGWGIKDFGAFDFYTPGLNYPSRERTEDQFFSFYVKKNIKSLYHDTRLYYHDAFDDFILDKEDPSFSRNIHNVKQYGIQSTFGLPLFQNLDISFVLGGHYERIDSSSLHRHRRDNYALGTEILYKRKKWGMNVSLRGDAYPGSRSYYSPSLGVYYEPGKNLKLRSAAGYSYRMPTFTDLYYQSSVNKGNENLQAERNMSYEAGADWYKKRFIVRQTFFYRHEYNLIDWVWRKDQWQAENINYIDFYGWESEFVYYFMDRMKIILRDSYVYARTTTDYVSKYGLNYTRNLLSFTWQFILPFEISTSINGTLKTRKAGDYFLTNLFMKRDVWQNSSIGFKIKNCFDRDYEEIKGIKQPPREWLIGWDIRV